jgi:citrate lyase beta subunit
MAEGLICSKLALAKSGDNGAWVLGTLYIHHDDIRFVPCKRRSVEVATHLTWPNISAIGCSKAGFLNALRVAHSGGVESYLCVGAKDFARALKAVRSQSRASPSLPFPFASLALGAQAA